MKKSNLRPSKGRPKLPADERKSIMVPVKFDIDQYQVMMDKALTAGLNRSEYIRQLALHCKVVERLTPRDVKAIRDLQGIAENLNRTAKFVGAILKGGASEEQIVRTYSIILPQNRTGSARKINPIKTLSEHGQQLKKKVFSGFQGQSSLGSAKRTDDAAGA